MSEKKNYRKDLPAQILLYICHPIGFPTKKRIRKFNPSKESKFTITNSIPNNPTKKILDNSKYYSWQFIPEARVQEYFIKQGFAITKDGIKKATQRNLLHLLDKVIVYSKNGEPLKDAVYRVKTTQKAMKEIIEIMRQHSLLSKFLKTAYCFDNYDTLFKILENRLSKAKIFGKNKSLNLHTLTKLRKYFFELSPNVIELLFEEEVNFAPVMKFFEQHLGADELDVFLFLGIAGQIEELILKGQEQNTQDMISYGMNELDAQNLFQNINKMRGRLNSGIEERKKHILSAESSKELLEEEIYDIANLSNFYIKKQKRRTKSKV